MRFLCLCLMTCVVWFGGAPVWAEDAPRFERVAIVVGAQAGPVEQKAAQLLEERLTELGGPAVTLHSGDAAPEAGPGLRIFLGVPENHRGVAELLDRHRLRVPDEDNLGPEGFHLRSFFDDDAPTLLAAAVDQRGALYAVGEILRRAVIHEDSVEFPPLPAPKRPDGMPDVRAPRNGPAIDVWTAPAFEVRGVQVGQSWVAKQMAEVRDWTEEELQRAVLDYALAGANVFEAHRNIDHEFLKSWDLMTQGGFGANTGSGPPEWQAEESIGRTGYVCLSVPEAVEAQLERVEAAFRDSPSYDFVKFHGGDGGGCECDLCKPYGLTFIKVVEQMAEIIHRYHPDTRIYFTNQKFDNDDDIAIFHYLQEEPREWLWAWGYGPGSDALSWQPGHRQTHRMDLFRYPGHGPFDRYNQEIIHEIPRRHELVHYNELTHWRYAQHGYIQMYPRTDRDGEHPPWWNHFHYERVPDQALTMVYDRLTFYAWPRFYHWLFGEVNRYGVGDITHSSGHHDHFNQWMWQRLLWAPQRHVEEVVDEYARTWFGPAAAPYMAEAIFKLEINLEEDPHTPLTEKDGIDRYYELVQRAGERIPAHQREAHWLWRDYMQKGALDLHTKLAVQEQAALQERVEQLTAGALEEGDIEAAIEQMLPWLDAIPAFPGHDGAADTPRMKELRAEAWRLGEESNALFGVRNEGNFNLEHDFIGLGWLRRQLERARDAENEAERRELLHMIVAYEDPGEGGFYDNLGTFNPAPNAVFGYPYDHGQPYVFGMLDQGNRPSQRSMHYTQDEEQGVTLHYRDLDPDASYRVRFTFVRPWFQERYAMRMNQKSQSIYAGEHLLAHELELPYQMSDFFTFDIPQEAIQDGELTLRLEKAADVATGDRVTVEQWRNSGGWGTLVSEVWLMRE